jgi:hypothetical protein
VGLSVGAGVEVSVGTGVEAAVAAGVAAAVAAGVSVAAGEAVAAGVVDATGEGDSTGLGSGLELGELKTEPNSACPVQEAVMKSHVFRASQHGPQLSHVASEDPKRPQQEQL